MSTPKQPDVLRARILEAALAVVLESGVHALTHERLLARLAVSKGGLQHHFRTKRLLLDALFEQLFAAFEAAYQAQLVLEPAGPARHTRAYVRVAATNGRSSRAEGRALTLLALEHPHYQARWSAFLAELGGADALPPEVQLACRLYADGLWYAHVVGPVPSDEQIEAATQCVLRLTEGA